MCLRVYMLCAQENHRSVLSALEDLEVTKDRLAEECRILKFKLEELEETSQEVNIDAHLSIY